MTPHGEGTLREWPDLGVRPHKGWSIDRRAVPEKADTYPLPPDERQRKEELVHSSRDKPPLNPIARGKSFRLRRSFSRAPVVSRILLFLFWTVHGPFSRFLLEEKEKMGGALHQPSLVANPPPPEGRVKASP